MKLIELFPEALHASETEITALTHDTSKVGPGALFFCLIGAKTDGHLYIAEARARGAAAAVVLHKTDDALPQITVADTRLAYACAAKRFFGGADERLTMIGITGTNGKTTTSYIVKSILEAAGYKTGIIGTNAVMIGKQSILAHMTTPDPVELYGYLKDMENAGVTHVVMEVSAHALALKKTDGIVYDVAAFTNFTRDHLDYFGTMEAYKRAKFRLFTEGLAKIAVINMDDPCGLELQRLTALPAITYGCNNPSDVFAVDVSLSEFGTEFYINILDDIRRIRFALPGRFNMYNVLCAAAVCRALNIESAAIARGVRAVKKVDGRFNVINTAKNSIIIDYAHTDDGLRNILSAVREFTKGRVITVFGCGGDRDREKRPLMGEAASELSDIAVVTSDNPRSEDPDAIIDDVMRGVQRCAYCHREPDRRKAILYAMEVAEEGDIVVVAGKGAEAFQEVKGERIPYNDEAFIQQLIRENRLI